MGGGKRLNGYATCASPERERSKKASVARTKDFELIRLGLDSTKSTGHRLEELSPGLTTLFCMRVLGQTEL